MNRKFNRPQLALSTLRRLASIFALILSLAGCGDYRISLPGGYSLVRVYSGAYLISFRGGDGRRLSGEIVIDIGVDRYLVLDHLVVGRVSKLDSVIPEDEVESVAGYFILNTRTHGLVQGLNRNTWLTTLQSLGVKDLPRLQKPSRLDSYFGGKRQ